MQVDMEAGGATRIWLYEICKRGYVARGESVGNNEKTNKKSDGGERKDGENKDVANTRAGTKVLWWLAIGKQ